MKSQEEHLRCAEAAKIDVVEALRVNYRGSSHLQPLAAPIEISFNEAVVRITNDVDPRLLAQILRSLGGCVC